MSGILWLLVFGALFYFMMRFGCGAHMVHGGHGGHGSGGGTAHGGHAEHEAQSAAVADLKDPVCGMDVAPASGYSRHYEGREYRFCSRKCLDSFDAEPARYAS
jgi:YHS domain-containing protein